VTGIDIDASLFVTPHERTIKRLKHHASTYVYVLLLGNSWYGSLGAVSIVSEHVDRPLGIPKVSYKLGIRKGYL
jgi:hypothetical protein